MLFDLTIHPLVLHLSTTPGIDLCAYYFDDATLVGSKQGVCSALHALHNLGHVRGVFMNTPETHLWWPNLVLHPSVPIHLHGLDHSLLCHPENGVTS